MKTTIKTTSAVLCLLLCTFLGMAQQSPKFQLSAIEAYRVQISTEKTTNIVFPLSIVSVDRGSRHILAQKAKGVENILQLKAANDSIRESNLSVVTSDGMLNSFILTYAKEPAMLNITLVKDARQGTIFLTDRISEAEVEACSKVAAGFRKANVSRKEKNFGIRFELNGLFVYQNVMYFRLKVENGSNISYDIDQIRFYIRDQKKAKRTASQEVEITPVNFYGSVEKVAGPGKNTMVVSLPKFTIPDKKYLAIQVMEANGGRHLELEVTNRDIFRAIPIRK